MELKTAKQHNAAQIGEYQFRHTTNITTSRPRLSVPAAGVRINLELLVADLAAKIRRRELDWKSVNLDDDLRGAIQLHEVAEVGWHTEPKPL
jgi:hypothetical protein